METAVAFDANGRATPTDPVVAEAARAALAQKGRTEQTGGPDIVAADAERALARRDLTETQLMIAQADRIDRATDAAALEASFPSTNAVDRASELQQQAEE